MLYPPECDVETKRCVNTFSKYGCLRSEGFDFEPSKRWGKNNKEYLPEKAIKTKIAKMLKCIPESHNDLSCSSPETCRACVSAEDNEKYCSNYAKNSIYNNHALKIRSQNWLSAQIVGTLVQIYTVEILKVPTKFIYKKNQAWIESEGLYEKYIETTLYSRADKAYDIESLRCDSSERNGKHCADVMMEVWRTIEGQIGSERKTHKLPLGATGQIGLFVPRFILDKYPRLASYRGFTEKFKDINAKIFKPPVTWSNYCRLYNSSNASGVTRTCPIPEEYKEKSEAYFYKTRYGDILYEGYFASNGSIGYLTTIDYCDWGEYSKFMFILNGIAIGYKGKANSKRNGYDLSQYKEIVNAAIKNNEAYFLWYWEPELLSSELKIGTINKEYEMVRVNFPTSYGECRDQRVAIQETTTSGENLCTKENNITVVQKNYPNANCDWAPDPLRKVVSKELENLGQGQNLTEVLYNTLAGEIPMPTYNMIKNILVDNELLDEMFGKIIAFTLAIDPSKNFVDVEQYLINQATCEVAQLNMGNSSTNKIITNRNAMRMMGGWVKHMPEKYICPEIRPFSKRSDSWSSMYIVFQVLAALSLVICILLAAFVWKNRKTDITIKRTQPMYTMVILSGSVLIFTHCLLALSEPSLHTNAGIIHCIASRFCRHVGIFATFVPLFVILGTITNILSAGGRRFSKHRGQREAKYMLYKTVISILFIVTYCIVWTIVQWEKSTKPKRLFSSFVENGETIFLYRSSCEVFDDITMEARVDYFSLAIGSVEILFVIWGVILAIRNGGVEKKEYDNSKAIAFAMYNGMFSLIIPILLHFELIKFAGDGSTVDLWSVMALWWIITVLIVFYYFPKVVNLITDSVKLCCAKLPSGNIVIQRFRGSTLDVAVSKTSASAPSESTLEMSESTLEMSESTLEMCETVDSGVKQVKNPMNSTKG
eukprot:g379.t1